MGDLYKCKKCGQLCYGVAVAEVDGNLAMEILNQINRNGYIEADDSIPFLDSDFSKFMIKRSVPGAVRYEADAGFPIVMENMQKDKVVIGSKLTEDGYSYLMCPICQSEEFYSTLGSLPTTFVDGKWDNFVESDHTWYLLSEGNGGLGSFTELERRELNNYINKEDRFDAKQLYDELIKTCGDSVVKKNNGFAQTKDVELAPYFRTLMNVKTDIQLLESRLFDLVLLQLSAERAFVNSTCRSEETIVNEIDKEKHQISVQIAMLEKELEFHQRGDWREVNHLTIPQEPVKPVMERPLEPVYRQPGLFNRKEVQEENDALREAYTAAVNEYNRRGREYTEQLKVYQEEKAYYDRRKEEILTEEKTAWDNDPDNIEKRKQIDDLMKRDQELNEMLKNPMKYAERMLEHSGPAKVKNLVESEIDRNISTLKKAYQIESDMQTILFVLPKYLDIFAVSKIYEYIVTDQVTSLTGAQGAYRMYDNETRLNRAPLMNVSKNVITRFAREYTIYNALSNVFRTMNEISQKTEAAINEIRSSNQTEAYDDYCRAIDVYYSLIQEDLKVCDEYAQKEIEENTPKQPEPEVPAEEADTKAAQTEEAKPDEQPAPEPGQVEAAEAEAETSAEASEESADEPGEPAAEEHAAEEPEPSESQPVIDDAEPSAADEPQEEKPEEAEKSEETDNTSEEEAVGSEPAQPEAEQANESITAEPAETAEAESAEAPEADVPAEPAEAETTAVKE